MRFRRLIIGAAAAAAVALSFGLPFLQTTAHAHGRTGETKRALPTEQVQQAEVDKYLQDSRE